MTVTPIVTDEELDAMSAEEARARFLFAAWIIRRQVREHDAMNAALSQYRQEMAEMLRTHRCEDPECSICAWKREHL